MTLRIADDFTLARSGEYLVVEVFGAFPARVRLTLEQTKLASEAFGIMAALLTPLEAYGEEEELEKVA